MNVVSNEEMKATCDKCGSVHSTNSLKDFKESNTYPPYAHFMCLDCKQMATLEASEMPRRLFAHLVAKVERERHAENERFAFNKMNDI